MHTLKYDGNFDNKNNIVHISYKNLTYRLTIKKLPITTADKTTGVRYTDLKWVGYVELFDNITGKRQKRLMGSYIKPAEGFDERKDAIKSYFETIRCLAYLENIFIRELNQKSCTPRLKRSRVIHAKKVS